MDLDKSLTLRNMREYMPLGALKMTTQKFYRVSGESTQYRGIVPDIVLPDRGKYNEYGERYLDYSLPWDSIDPVDHKEWPLIDLITLYYNSQKRVSADDDFNEIQRVADAMSERIIKSRQSLLLVDIVSEKDDLYGMGDSPHGMADVITDEEEDDEKQDDKRDPVEKLIEDVLEDAYAVESMAILTDMLSLQDKVAGKGR
jgi:carboxyl-terminal processing protease